MKELGIIIPAYNAHDTIRKLLHSIGCFSFLDKVKVIIVDDASEKTYDYLIDDFKDLDLHLITLTKNVGPGFARQVGIDYCIEEEIPYLMFADSDDYFIDFFFWNQISPDIKEKNDIFIFNFFDEEGQCSMNDLDIWMFSKIYKTKIIKKHNIRFINSYCNEDVVFNFAYFAYITNVCKSDSTIYFWYKRENSLSRQEDYLYRSIKEVSSQIAKMFEIHKEYIPQDKIPSTILSRMIRIFCDVNEALLIYPDLFTNKKKHKECLRGIKDFYRKCYRPYEAEFTKDRVISEFLNLHSENGSSDIFQSIDYFSFIKKLKETS